MNKFEHYEGNWPGQGPCACDRCATLLAPVYGADTRELVPCPPGHVLAMGGEWVPWWKSVVAWFVLIGLPWLLLLAVAFFGFRWAFSAPIGCGVS